MVLLAAIRTVRAADAVDAGLEAEDVLAALVPARAAVRDAADAAAAALVVVAVLRLAALVLPADIAAVAVVRDDSRLAADLTSGFVMEVISYCVSLLMAGCCWCCFAPSSST
mmetsp:Transcript_30449/g.65871  ORF Transcript_30449/g.65871 Transcript_30449/m.65871 type:complete len:112 (+) Transcript_30449:556-891(+)